MLRLQLKRHSFRHPKRIRTKRVKLSNAAAHGPRRLDCVFTRCNFVISHAANYTIPKRLMPKVYESKVAGYASQENAGEIAVSWRACSEI